MTESAQTPTVLVVDDTEDNRELIRRRLERAGYQVITAPGGVEALEYIGRGGIDLVILDIMMPGLTGIDVLRSLRRDFSSVELPVIMATAKDQSEDVVEALEAGANDYVTKPLDFPVIMARVQAHLRAKAAATVNAAASREARLHFRDIRPGLELAGKYRLESPIGQGNFGIVYSALHLGLQEQVAIKILQGSTVSENDEEGQARFQQEAVSAFRLQHPNAVRVFDFGVTQGLAFLVMERLQGETLEALMKRERVLSPQRCAQIVLPICEVLAEAHEMGIIHRDIKPANIFLHRSHRGETVKVLDFGIAKLVGDAAVDQNLTLEEGILGTPAYMAPERLSSQSYDGRSDVYSLGIVLYQMLCGSQPYPKAAKGEAIAVAVQHLTSQPERLSTYMPEVPIQLEALVMSTLRKSAAERPAASALAQELGQALAGSWSAHPTPAPVAAEDDIETRLIDTASASRLGFSFADLVEAPADSKLPADRPLPGLPPKEVDGEWH